ncbi:transposase [Fundicoccus sp. Sow4_D5]|uniref:transposase n=1 Tax=Fundicoccus sp. Sow4_D5 TaxID=3438782 RepID=UPI003F930CA0
MGKYGLDFKLKVVMEYLNTSQGYTSLAKKYHMPSPSTIAQWVAAYEGMGIEGLDSNRKTPHYSVQFKLNAVELYLTTDISYKKLAKQLKIPHAQLIYKWVKLFEAKGIEGLDNPKERMKEMKTQPTKQPLPQDESLETAAQDEKDLRIQQLEAQNRKLEIEIGYLKELRRLRQLASAHPVKK